MLRLVVQLLCFCYGLAENERVDQFNIGRSKNVPNYIKVSMQSPLAYNYGKRSGSSVDTHNCDRITSVPAHLTFITKYRFYQKYLHAYGLPVISSSRVSDRALKRACTIIRFIFADRKDVRESMYKNFGRFGVIALQEKTTTIPEFSHLPDWWNQRARGLGGVLGRPISTAGEENLLCSSSDKYRGDDIFFHEANHGFAEVGIKGGGIPGFYNRLIASYNKARRLGRWRNTYAMTDSREYWSEGVQSFFENHPESIPTNNIHNHVNTRAELKSYDPDLYRLVKEAYPCMNTYTMCNNNFLGSMRMNCDGSSTLPPPQPKTTPGGPEPPPTKCITTWEINNTPRRNANCRDLSGYCRGWAQGGYCRTSVYTKKNCCKSCGGGGGGGSCADLDGRCPGWAQRGECSRNPAYMNVNCKKSCKLCTTTTKKKVKKCWVITTAKPIITVKPPLPQDTTIQPPLPQDTTIQPPLPQDTTVQPTLLKVTTTKKTPSTTFKPLKPDTTVTNAPNPFGTPPIPKDCAKALAAGVETKRIPDGAMTASSVETKWHDASQGRLNLKSNVKGVGSWCAGVLDKKQYLQVDLGQQKTIKEFKTQGSSSSFPSYVSKYTIEYSDDGSTWYFYADVNNYVQPQVFDGNTDNAGIKHVKIDVPVVGRYFRVKPTEWKNVICLRLEIYTC